MIIDSRFRGSGKEGMWNNGVQCKVLCLAQNFTSEIIYPKLLLNDLFLLPLQLTGEENVKLF